MLRRSSLHRIPWLVLVFALVLSGTAGAAEVLRVLRVCENFR